MRTTLFLDETITAADEPNSDATRLTVHVPSGLTNSVEMVESVTALRQAFGSISATTYKRIFRTRQHGAYGDRLGGWDYYWDPDSVETDDGVLTFEVDFVTTGRLKAVRPPDGMMNALACGPASADLGSRTKSFDPLGVVAIGTELTRVSKILSDDGWAGIKFPDGTYKVVGGESVATRSRGQGFSLEGSGNTIFQGPAYDIDTSSQGLIHCSRADGAQDQYGNLPFFTAYVADSATTVERSWTQTFTGSERTMVGVSNIGAHGTCSALAVGDICFIRIGAERTDAAFWAMGYYAEIESITPTTGTAGDVKFKQPLPEVPPTGVGVNVNRTQTKHDMIKIQVDGFQDNLKIKNLIFDQVFMGANNTRNAVYENCHWKTTTFAFNLTSTFQTRVTNCHIENMTGTDSGHIGDRYGGAFALQACYNTFIESVKIDNLDGTFFVGEELSCRGTKIGLADITWSAQYNLVYANCAIFTQNIGTTNILSCDHLVLRGGYNNCSWGHNVRVGLLEDRSSHVTANRHFPLWTVDRLVCRIFDEPHERSYSTRRTTSHMVPLSTTPSGTVTVDVPIHGLCRRLRVKTTNLSDLNTMVLSAAGESGGWYDLIASNFVTAADTWFEIDAAAIEAVGSPNSFGYLTIRIETTSKVSPPPAGSFLSVECEMFVRDPDTFPTGAGYGDLNETSKDTIVCSDGAPTFDSDFIGQDCLDSSSSPRKWYKSVNTGTGASDWVALN